MVSLAREKLGFTISGCHFFVYSPIKRPLECNYRDNIEFSCPAASTQNGERNCQTACIDPDGLQGDNCNDLLHGDSRQKEPLGQGGR